MLTGNLATRPFYNERLVTLAMVLVAAIAVALTYFNVQEFQLLSDQRAALQLKVDANDAQTSRLMTEANTIRQSVDQQALRALASGTREANDLIEQRTFSWTVLLGVLEKTLPLDVRLLAISPKIDKGNTKVTMTAVAKRYENIKQFVDALWNAQGMFYSVLLAGEQRNDDGTYNMVVEAYYLAPSSPPRRAGGGKGRP
jgi:type IV pilus assembly protein PilN